jgi:2,3-diaminopropionate biosynthesis protein SbnA
MRTSLQLDHPFPASWEEFRARLGNTPQLPVRVRVGDRWRGVWLKLEARNPSGSTKDRTAYSLVQSLEAGHGDGGGLTIIESTSGNLGSALALICNLRGHQFIAVVDPKIAASNLELMCRLGAEIQMVREPDEHGNYLVPRLERVQVLLQARPDAHWADQYSNDANPRIHYLQTGPEILRQTHERVDAVYVATSTGGTLAGIATYLRAMKPAVRVVAVDAVGSLLFSDRAAPRHLTGIGANHKSPFIRPEQFDASRLVDDATAFAYCRKVHQEIALPIGGSSGASIAACVEDLAEHPELENPVCILADDGRKYRDTIYQDAWLNEIGLPIDKYLQQLEDCGICFRPAERDDTGG